MDKNELSLEEIIAANNAIRAEVEGNAAESSGADSERTLGEIISEDSGNASDKTEAAAEEAEITADEQIGQNKHMLTADEILADDTLTDSVSDEIASDETHSALTADEILAHDTLTGSDSDETASDGTHSELTVDEILNEVNTVDDAEVEEVKPVDDAVLAEILGESSGAGTALAVADENDADKTDESEEDEYDDIDNEPTVIMPRSGRTPSNRHPASRRRTSSRKKVHKKQKPSKFNGTIFGGVILTCIILTVSIVLDVTGISIATEYYGIGKSDNDVIFNIPEGSTNENIADLLYENGIINNKTLFLLALKIEKPETLYPGDITLQASMGYPDVIEKLSTQRKKLKTVNVTITEGMNLLEVAKLLEKNKVCKADDFLFEFNKDQGFDFEKDLGVNKDAFYKMEGYFFPETYNFYVDDTAYNVTKIVREQFQNVLNADIMRQVKANKLSLNEIITLASIVQMESGSEKEMPKVASVFINRLNDKDTYPNLQSDTTDKYIEKVIRKKAVDSTSADHYAQLYDTYKCVGLPASPICNPGLAAIKAVLNPEKTDYYFFCNNLATGEAFYARTNEEHEANLRKAGLKKDG